MDQLHEELKEPLPEPYDQSSGITVDDGHEEDNRSQSDNDFQSCESCGSSDRADNEVQGGNVLIEDTNEAEMLIPEQDEIQANREWQKEKNMINDFYRSGVNGVMGGSTGVDMDKDVDTTTEATPIISSQGAIKVQGRTTGNCGDYEAECRALFFRLLILHQICTFKTLICSLFSTRFLPRHPNVNQQQTTESSPDGGTHSQNVQQPAQGCLRLAQPKPCTQERYFCLIRGSHTKIQSYLVQIFADILLSTTLTFLPLCLCGLSAVTTFSPPKNKRQKKYRSVISDVFDGTIVSSVQCLTCDRVSADATVNFLVLHEIMGLLRG